MVAKNKFTQNKSSAVSFSQYSKFKNSFGAGLLKEPQPKPIKSSKYMGGRERPVSASNYKRNFSNRPRDKSEEAQKKFFTEKQNSKKHARKPGSARVKDNRG